MSEIPNQEPNQDEQSQDNPGAKGGMPDPGSEQPIGAWRNPSPDEQYVECPIGKSRPDA